MKKDVCIYMCVCVFFPLITYYVRGTVVHGLHVLLSRYITILIL